MGRKAQDDELTRLVRAGKIRLIPEENQKTIRQADRSAALHIGGEDRHLIAFTDELDAPRRSASPRSRPTIRRLEERTLTNLERLTTRDSKPTAEQLRAAMPDMSAADLDFALERLRKKGFLGDGDQLTVTALGRNRLSEPNAFRQPRRQFPRRRAREAAGHDVTPGHDELHHFWTRDPRGLARWVKSAHPFTTLTEQLVEHAHVPVEVAHRWAGAWFQQVFHFAAGSDLNRVTHGHPPRGHLVGPG